MGLGRPRTAEADRRFGWQPLRARIPEDTTIEHLWQTPHGDELWLDAAGDGLFRVRLASGEVVRYAAGLAGFRTEDIIFTPNGRLACLVSSGTNGGIAVIELASGKVSRYPKNIFFNAKLAAAPDNRTVWCSVNGLSFFAFDLEAGKVTGECSGEKGIPLSLSGFFPARPTGNSCGCGIGMGPRPIVLPTGGGGHSWVSSGKHFPASLRRFASPPTAGTSSMATGGGWP